MTNEEFQEAVRVARAEERALILWAVEMAAGDDTLQNVNDFLSDREI